jgi:myo-inositol-1(or 4)-monophosphatase
MSTSPETRSPFLSAAVEAVLKAGEIQLAHLGTNFRISRKGEVDIVTAVDLEVEAMFRAMVRQRFPGHGVLAEEMAETRPAAGDTHRWLFDPIDGTANYARGLPFFCASLALEVQGAIEVAAVYDPSRRELFTAERGKGAWLNAQPARVSTVDRFGAAALGTGFPHGALVRASAMENVLSELSVRVRAIRRLGSAALDLCYVGCGRMDGFWDRNLKPWDTAAGALIVEEAGGTVTGLDGEPFSCHSGSVLASNGPLHEAMLTVIRSHASTV